MLSDAVVLGAGLIWLGLLFGAALWGERRPDALGRHWHLVYALSLAVYCTSWTFYGTVTQAARSGWPIPPTFVGTILLYVFGLGLLLRLVGLAREHNASSLADLIATRLGKDARLAAAVTAVAVLGMLPYIALQLKAVAMSYGLLTRAADLAPPPWQDSAFYVALLMALFAMLFGARRATATAHNRGLVLAMAVESLLKLGAMLAMGAFVWLGLDSSAPATSAPPPAGGSQGFAPLAVLGAIAMFTLPHQFHVGVVECRDPQHLRTARWLFPLYMVLIALPTLPLAWAGQALLAPLGVPSDLYVLALPLAAGREGLALVAFLGGLSAAVGMVILATLALSIMIGNHWLAPLLVRGPWTRRADGDLRGAVLVQRRLAIGILLLLAWLYSRALVGNDALADIGAVSFSALATLAPALGFAIWRPHTPANAVLVGLLAAVGVWLWTLLLPALAEAGAVAPGWRVSMPAGLDWLAPDGLFGLSAWSRLGRAVTLSLFAGTVVTWLLASRWRSFRDSSGAAMDVAALRRLAARFLPEEQLALAFAEGAAGGQGEPPQARIERELASVLGAASARLLLETAQRRQGRDLEAVVDLVGEASQALRFNQRLLEAALENMSQGISVVDKDLRLVAWNRRYAELFGFPEELLQVGRPIADLARWALERGFAGAPRGLDPRDGRSEIQPMLARRLAHMHAGSAHLSERRFPDGTMVEIRGNPMPGGGFVATFTDVTAFRRAESELKQVAESLEHRVAERTAELAQATAAAERANQAKSRLLAAVSHDLAQPLHAAQLFAHALLARTGDEAQRLRVHSILGALASSESLLTGLLDLSRLEAGGLRAEPRAFALGELLALLGSEFGVLAAERGLRLAAVPTRAWARSDPNLLRRILQNFLSNAVHHTASGRVLLGCRHGDGHLRIEVWDTGPGIDAAERETIFEEFRRGRSVHGQGLGLGLAIARRTAELLGHPIGVRSWPGRGSVFWVRVPMQAPLPELPAPAHEHGAPARPARILVLDNDAAVLDGMRALLESWGLEAICARHTAAAVSLFRAHAPRLVILDYHLDGGEDGLRAWTALRAIDADVRGIVITADHSAAVREAAECAGLGILHKPLKPLALRSVIERQLSASQSCFTDGS